MANFNGWIAFLSDGSSVPETKPVAGKRTPWQLLLQKCRDENIHINRMTLVFNNVQIMSINKKQCDGYFQAREIRKDFFRSMGLDGKKEVLFQGIGSVIGDLVFITWFTIHPKTNITAYISTEVRPLESCIIHTTLS